jgi:hypothetical protein
VIPHAGAAGPTTRISGECCTMTFQIRQLGTGDYPLVISVIDQWWGGRQMADKLPRLFFEHFSDTSFAAHRSTASRFPLAMTAMAATGFASSGACAVLDLLLTAARSHTTGSCDRTRTYNLPVNRRFVVAGSARGCQQRHPVLPA